jgi:tRNA (mo5U34)-methyltransferase
MKRSLQQTIDTMAPWFHNFHFPDGSQTAPAHPLGDFPTFKWKQLAPHLPRTMKGFRALDIGCNAGFYSIEMARRGASVLGIDVDEHYLKQARWAARYFGLEHSVQFRKMQVYDLRKLPDVFDLVLFMGVFYHLKYPVLGLDIVAEKVGALMVFQSLTMPGTAVWTDTHDHKIDNRGVFEKKGWPKMAFVEHRFAGDPTNWWVPNHSCIEALLRTAGFKIVGRPGHEMYLCRPRRKNPDRCSDPEYLSIAPARKK